MNNIEIRNGFACDLRAFTLVELLTVIAVISVLLSLTVPVITSTSSTRNEEKALTIAEGTAAAARQYAVSKGTMVALLLSGTSTAVNINQNFFLLQASVTGTGGVNWTPLSSWVELPPSVAITPYVRNGITTFYSMSSGQSSYSLPTTWNNHNLTNYFYIVFFPDGSVDAPASGPAINLQRTTSQSGTTPDYTLLIQDSSGRLKIISSMQ